RDTNLGNPSLRNIGGLASSAVARRWLRRFTLAKGTVSIQLAPTADARGMIGALHGLSHIEVRSLSARHGRRTIQADVNGPPWSPSWASWSPATMSPTWRSSAETHRAPKGARPVGLCGNGANVMRD
ncbi:MAG: hypothetical protein ACRDZ3_12825, partial [Acidimicrobiia bacterium]